MVLVIDFHEIYYPQIMITNYFGDLTFNLAPPVGQKTLIQWKISKTCIDDHGFQMMKPNDPDISASMKLAFVVLSQMPQQQAFLLDYHEIWCTHLCSPEDEL